MVEIPDSVVGEYLLAETTLAYEMGYNGIPSDHRGYTVEEDFSDVKQRASVVNVEMDGEILVAHYDSYYKWCESRSYFDYEWHEEPVMLSIETVLSDPESAATIHIEHI